jgi:porin
LGVGLNWSRPDEDVFGPGLDGQYTAEIYYRFQVMKVLTVTPDVQLIIDPALNPQESSIWVFGLRARLAL